MYCRILVALQLAKQHFPAFLHLELTLRHGYRNNWFFSVVWPLLTTLLLLGVADTLNRGSSRRFLVLFPSTELFSQFSALSYFEISNPASDYGARLLRWRRDRTLTVYQPASMNGYGGRRASVVIWLAGPREYRRCVQSILE